MWKHNLHYLCIPYARHYKPRLVYFFYPISLCLRLILQTIYVLKMEILHFLSLKSAAYKRERLQIVSGLWWRAYGMQSWIHGHHLNKMPRTLHGEMPLLLTKTNFSWHFRLKPHNLWTLMGVVQVIYAVMDSSFTHAHHSIKMPRTLHGMHGT